MRYHNIIKGDMLNGDGLRVVLWVSGCNHNCKEYHNPITWDIRSGLPFDQVAKEESSEELEKSYMSGVILGGGDPLHPDNREDIGKLVDEIYNKFPNKAIWLYTGYGWEDICQLPFIRKVDVVVDGKFIMVKKDDRPYWKGSSNQKVIDVQYARTTGVVVLHES